MLFVLIITEVGNML